MNAMPPAPQFLLLTFAGILPAAALAALVRQCRAASDRTDS
jgi:hypothetical protein